MSSGGEIAASWTRSRPWIEAALANDGFYDIGYLERGIADGSMRLWAGRDCAAVTEFIDYPLVKVLNVFAGGGVSGKALTELTREIEPKIVDWAKANGARKIIGFGSHEGWKPVCERMGYRHLWTVMQKDIAP